MRILCQLIAVIGHWAELHGFRPAQVDVRQADVVLLRF